MNYFLGIFPDESALGTIKDATKDIRDIFTFQSIPVSWVSPSKYHITVLFLGNELSWLKRRKVTKRFGSLERNSFELKLLKIRLGIGKNKNTLYYDVISQSGELRELAYRLPELLQTKRRQVFIPHLTLGRIAKDLSTQEYRNLHSQINKYNLEHEGNYIAFQVNEIKLIESDTKSYKVLKNFDISSSA